MTDEQLETLAAANAVIGEASERYAKNLWTDRTSRDLPRLVAVRDEAEQANYVAVRFSKRARKASR